MSKDQQRIAYQADLIAYHLQVLERLAKGTKYAPQIKQALKLMQEIK